MLTVAHFVLELGTLRRRQHVHDLLTHLGTGRWVGLAAARVCRAILLVDLLDLGLLLRRQIQAGKRVRPVLTLVTLAAHAGRGLLDGRGGGRLLSESAYRQRHSGRQCSRKKNRSKNSHNLLLEWG